MMVKDKGREHRDPADDGRFTRHDYAHLLWLSGGPAIGIVRPRSPGVCPRGRLTRTFEAIRQGPYNGRIRHGLFRRRNLIFFHPFIPARIDAAKSPPRHSISRLARSFLAHALILPARRPAGSTPGEPCGNEWTPGVPLVRPARACGVSSATLFKQGGPYCGY